MRMMTPSTTSSILPAALPAGAVAAGGVVSTTRAANGSSLIAEAGTASFPVLSFRRQS